ncbi:TLC domain-containing protein [Panaeolus papilionaceus]|nr:TLC domain-containing protein [Panaeolus papilionaceus]
MGKKQPAPIHIDDKNHHLTGAFEPQTPLDAATPPRSASPALHAAFEAQRSKRSLLVRWIVDPYISFKIILLPVVLYTNWELLAPYVQPGVSNPFAPLFLLSGYVPTSKPDDPRYQKTWQDLLFLAYYIVFFSFIRQAITINISGPLAKYFGLKRQSKIERFGEQVYALIYFSFFGACGYRVMNQLLSSWYNTTEFWQDYPHWDMKPDLKRYYLMQFSYWCQQLLVLLLGLEKPRKDYAELVAHHFVTLWLVGWSYLVNMTYIGNAVYMSMDIPDAFLAFSKILNYIQWNKAKVYSFLVFFGVWTYFRHYLNLHILWSVWSESPNVPEWTRRWSWSEGIYMPAWMRYQIFLPLLLLQLLNLFWYSLMVKILIRAIATAEADDDRSDDEGDDEPDNEKED